MRVLILLFLGLEFKIKCNTENNYNSVLEIDFYNATIQDQLSIIFLLFVKRKTRNAVYLNARR